MTKVDLPGFGPVDVISDAEAENVDFVVCILSSVETPFAASNILSYCSGCGREIQHRPHVPKKPKKICLDCAITYAEENAAKHGSGSVKVTTATKDELH